MDDKDRRLTDAAMRYLQMLDGDEVLSISEFVRKEDPELRDELAPYLQEVLSFDIAEPPPPLSPEQQALADRVATRFDKRVKALTGAQVPRSLTEVRMARELSLRDVAAELNVPPALVARIERGEVQAATIPTRFLQRLATTVMQPVSAVQALLTVTPTRTGAALSYSAQDGTVVPAAESVSFAEALSASGATDAQRREWE